MQVLAADIACAGGPLFPARRTSEAGVAAAVNALAVFVVVRAASHQAAAELFRNNLTIFPCDAVDVRVGLGGGIRARARKFSRWGKYFVWPGDALSPTKLVERVS